MAHPVELLRLRGMTWNHTRGYIPMVATAQRFSELNSGVEIIWEKRTLQEFADQPIDQLAERYDLLVIDHPWAGFAAAAGLLVPLDEHLPASFLADQAANSVGPSHPSYCLDGHQWALAIDAATPVASWRPDLIAASDLPPTWNDLLRLARAGSIAMAGIPVDILMDFYMVCSTLGEDVCQGLDSVVSPQDGVQALEMLRELALTLDPVFWDLNPIGVGGQRAEIGWIGCQHDAVRLRERHDERVHCGAALGLCPEQRCAACKGFGTLLQNVAGLEEAVRVCVAAGMPLQRLD